jgi:alkylresorcinol/alkylpyrone synthase
MFLHSIASAVPPNHFTQLECWAALDSNGCLDKLRPSSRTLLSKVLHRDNGIHSRSFSEDRLEKVFARNADELNEAFRRDAPRLAGAALKQALEKAGLKADEVDALFVCTCTGYLCPGISSYVAESHGLRSDVYLNDMVGLGCGAALPMLRAVAGFLAIEPDAIVVAVAVEISSAAFYLDDDAGVLISACLFGDGASASVWGNRPAKENSVECRAFRTVHQPEHRDLLRFEMRGGKLRNLLHRSVPVRVAAAVETLWKEDFRNGHRPDRVLAHAGGRDVLDALVPVFEGREPAESRSILRQYGNMSSPSVLFALEAALKNRTSTDHLWWLTSFGAGFAAHSCQITLRS